MKKQEIKSYQYILDQDEMSVIFDALQYTRHRILNHPNCGARKISLEKIEDILKAFDYKFSYKYENQI